MNPDNDFEDWSHPTRSLSMPPRRGRIHWQWVRAAVVLLGLALACGLFALCWYAGHAVSEAYRVVFGS